jgi:hypothetical protein
VSATPDRAAEIPRGKPCQPVPAGSRRLAGESPGRCSLAALRCHDLVRASGCPPSWSSYSRSRSRSAHAPQLSRGLFERSDGGTSGTVRARHARGRRPRLRGRSHRRRPQPGLGRLRALLALLRLALSLPGPARPRGHWTASAAWTSASAPGAGIGAIAMSRSAVASSMTSHASVGVCLLARPCTPRWPRPACSSGRGMLCSQVLAHLLGRVISRGAHLVGGRGVLLGVSTGRLDLALRRGLVTKRGNVLVSHRRRRRGDPRGRLSAAPSRCR